MNSLRKVYAISKAWEAQSVNVAHSTQDVTFRPVDSSIPTTISDHSWPMPSFFWGYCYDF